jgi:putative aldouronate transport system substrate-binding protein
MKIVNLFNRDESKMDMSVGSNTDEVLRLPQAMYDEGEVTYKAMLDVLMGKAKPEDFADPKYDVYKLLKDDVAKIGTAKLAPFDNMDIQYWDTKSTVWSRAYSILDGNGAIYNPIGGKDKVNVVYSMTYAPTPLVATKWANLQALESAVFLKIILGTEPIDSFDKFVTDWKAQGGDDLTAEIQASIK